MADVPRTVLSELRMARRVFLNYLCAGLKRFFTHSRPYLQRLASLMRAGEPIERLMHLVRSEDIHASAQTGRNNPCPCGSGRKYKKCCLGKRSLG